jgi:hypothetical protein
MASLGQNQFQLSFQISPIILTNGIASNVPGGGIPIVQFLQGQNFSTGLLSGGSSQTDPDQYFAQFVPLPGAMLIDNAVGTYPFANQAVAANAIIANPLTISLKMICPWRQPGDAQNKLATLTSLRTTLQQHSFSGGTYTIVTLSYIYTNCLLTAMKDISSGDSRQFQYEWELDFFQPLLTLQQAQAAQNSLINAVSGGNVVTGNPPTSTGLAAQVGFPPSIAMPGIIPSSSGLTGSNVAGPSATSLGFPTL